MNLATYQSLVEKVGLSKMDAANKDTYNIVKEGSANFTDPNLWNEMLADADIKDAYDLHIKSLESLAEKKSEPAKPKMKVSRSKAKRSTKVKPAPAPKVVKAKVKKAAKKVAAKKQEVKFPVTVKKLSKELQLIKRMANMDGKRKTLGAVRSLMHEVEKVKRPDRKSLMKDIHEKLAGVVLKAEAAGVKELDITLGKEFHSQLVESVKDAQPKMKVEYLAGLEKKK